MDGRSPRRRRAALDFWNTKAQKLSAAPSSEPESYPIPPAVAEYFMALKGMHERHLGRPVGKGDNTFLSPMGRPLHGDNLRDDFYEILVAADIPRYDHRGRSLDLHAARTTVYARGAEAGIPAD